MFKNVSNTPQNFTFIGVTVFLAKLGIMCGYKKASVKEGLKVQMVFKDSPKISATIKPSLIKLCTSIVLLKAYPDT